MKIFFSFPTRLRDKIENMNYSPERYKYGLFPGLKASYLHPFVCAGALAIIYKTIKQI